MCSRRRGKEHEGTSWSARQQLRRLAQSCFVLAYDDDCVSEHPVVSNSVSGGLVTSSGEACETKRGVYKYQEVVCFLGWWAVLLTTIRKFSRLYFEEPSGARGASKRQARASREAMSSRLAVIVVVAVVITTSPGGTVSAFGSSPGALSGGHVNTLITTSSTSSFLKVGGGSRSSGVEGSSTSLWSAYAVKPEMAKKQGSEWRKLRTRGPGFGEKVSSKHRGCEVGVRIGL